MNYTLDFNVGFTQALSDGTYTYLYGNGRIAQVETTAEYFLGDATIPKFTLNRGVVEHSKGTKSLTLCRNQVIIISIHA